MYADYEYYIVEYRMTAPPVIPGELFAYWEKQARAEIDKRTFGRLQANPALVSDKVKDCACELAELLYQADTLSRQAMEHGGTGPLASYSNDGESGTFDLTQSPYTELGKAVKVREIIYKHLAYTGLLYAGVC